MSTSTQLHAPVVFITDACSYNEHMAMIGHSEPYNQHNPILQAELEHNYRLRQELSKQHQFAQSALRNWRNALAQRWESEVAGQRLYLKLHAFVRNHYGADTPFLRLIAPDHNQARTAEELLADLRRIEASFRIVEPQPLWIEEHMSELCLICEQLDRTLAYSRRCESERRSAMLSRRLAEKAYQQSIERVHTLMEDPIQMEDPTQQAIAVPFADTGD